MRRRTLAVILLLALLGGGGFLPAAQAPTAREQDLARIRQEMTGLEERLAQLGGKAEGLSGELERIEVELALQKIRVDEARAARDVAVERADAGEAALAVTAGDLDTARDQLEVRLRGLYRLGLYGYLRLLLSIDPGADPLEAVRLLRFMARRDAAAVDRFVAARDRLADQQRRLEAERQDALRWAEQEEERRRRLDQLRRRQAGLLAQVEDQKRELEARAEELKDKERKLTSFLDVLSGESSAPFEDRPIQEFRGVLDWPLPGEVVIGFGPRLDPRYRTRLPHSGIRLAVQPGQSVRAIYPGNVLFADAFEGYGTMVVIAHAGRVFSIYAGLAEVGVEKGDVVPLNHGIGVSADSLYLEIREEKRAVDPLEWLR